MKIRSRLIVSFFVMIFMPVLLISLCVCMILKKQGTLLSETYNIDFTSYVSYETINPISLLMRVGSEEHLTISEVADDTPEKLLDETFLDEINEKLLAQNSYLVVFCNSSCSYIGNKTHFAALEGLPVQDEENEATNDLIYIDTKAASLIRGYTFSFSDKSLGQFFVVTDFSEIQPHYTNAIRDIAIAILITLLLTGSLLVFWIYDSILRPLNILRLATVQIGGGNLNDPIPITSSDEIGLLCRDFEEMRIRLKSLLDEQIQAEENSREIMSCISHDLKTPITAIKGYTEGILDGVADTPQKQEKYLHTIYAKANDITYLIDELSLFSMVEHNSLAYHFVSVDADQYFSDCLDDISLDMESENITIDYQNHTEPGTQIVVDTEQLKRVLHNIIGNAVKYNDKENGHILIRIDNVKTEPVQPPLYRQIREDGTDLVPPKQPAAFIRVEITDNGCGIATKDLPHIFDRFYRADASRNSSKRGSGLGLAIVKMIISAHDGRVWAESTEGVGSSFYFTLKKGGQEENE